MTFNVRELSRMYSRILRVAIFKDIMFGLGAAAMQVASTKELQRVSDLVRS